MAELDYSIPKKRLPPGAEVHISDTTLRDGAQMPGIVMGEPHKLRIFDYLHQIGIEKVECFVFSEADRTITERMLERGYAYPRVTAWARANKDDIDTVARVGGIDEVGILMSVSDLHIFKKIGFPDRGEAEKSYLSAFSRALEKGLAVRCHLEDVTRSDFSGFVAPLVEKMLALAPDAIIRICDTVGIGLPDPNMELPRGIPHLVRALKALGVKHVETHMHDDFGNAVANSLAGFDYGADWTSAAFLGIGERAGNAKMEEILINLQYVEGLQNQYDLSCLTEFAGFMERELGIAVPGNKAVIGK
ncbi:MAG: isopropylmalate synthase, partial [Chloroflexi bacterium]|nr:isopropylmalate synthase [Chloroflexota bacterium]